jgi:hypothetical protein
MRENIAHASHAAPGNFWVFVLARAAHVAGGFAKDFKAAFHRQA